MSNLYGFELVVEKRIEELNTTARLFRYTKTGTELLSLENNDENKAFGIAFRTPPSDSTGIAHIMEHAVLCGSRKYPVKEPFVELLKGSLKTFLNAFTSPDNTVYPVASQNVQDFYNLVDVYFDAVFYPRLTPYTLQQEGWHYELDSLDGPLSYKGVVFNEMKGVYSSPDSVLSELSQQVLFPNHTYGVDSGGHPKEIPNLTYKQFKNFHQTYYHPSNARIYFYGDDDPETRLRLAADYLKDFDYKDVDSNVPLQSSPKDIKPQYVNKTYAVGAEDESSNKSMVTVNWLVPDITTIEARMAFNILAYILVSTSASPLKKALIDSGLGEDLTRGGASNHLKQTTFSTGLKGIAKDDAKKVEALILKVLDELVCNGIDPDMIEAAMNTVEFKAREQNTGSFPRGLALMLGALNNWLHDKDPLESLAFEAPLTALKKHVAEDKNFFENLIKQHLLLNQHRITLTLSPDREQQAREEAEEKERLAKAKADMTQPDLEKIIKDAKILKEMQATPDSPEALATIPRLQLTDLDKKNKLIPLQVIKEKETEILYHNLFTNGIVYLDIGFDMHTIPQDLLAYVPLFSLALLQIGTEKEDFVKLSQRIGQKTGGIWATSLLSAKQGVEQGIAKFILRGKCTLDHMDDLLDILRDVLLTVKLDNQPRLKQVLLKDKAHQEASVVPSGHAYVMGRLGAHFSVADWVAEEMDGISNLFFTRWLVEEVDKAWPNVLEKLEKIRNLLLNRNSMFCNVTLDEANWATFRPKLNKFIADMPDQALQWATWVPVSYHKYEGLTIPARVNYVGKGANLYELGYKYHGSVSVINNYLRTSWLWEKIRVQGGAYGGFCTFDRHSGGYNYVSYRDPNLLETLDVYDATSQFLHNLELSDSELSSAIIGSIGKMDSYQLPDAKGYSSMVRYLMGYSDEDRQQARDEILGTTPADFKAFGDALATINDNGIVVVLGSVEAIEAANSTRDNWLKTVKVL